MKCGACLSASARPELRRLLRGPGAFDAVNELLLQAGTEKSRSGMSGPFVLAGIDLAIGRGQGSFTACGQDGLFLGGELSLEGFVAPWQQRDTSFVFAFGLPPHLEHCNCAGFALVTAETSPKDSPGTAGIVGCRAPNSHPLAGTLVVQSSGRLALSGGYRYLVDQEL